MAELERSLIAERVIVDARRICNSAQERRILGNDLRRNGAKQQGEYVVVVRGVAAAKGLPFEQPLSVYKIDHIPKRWYVILVAIGSVLGLIGTLIGLFRRPKEKTRP